MTMKTYLVVPLVGTWIETVLLPLLSALYTASFPSWERGLKRSVSRKEGEQQSVVPLVGTWIETWRSTGNRA